VAKRRSKGEGSLYFYEKASSWVAQITLPNGQRKSKSSKTQKEAREWLISQRNKASEGVYIADDRLQLGDFLDRYIEDVAAHSLRPRSLTRNAQIVRTHINPELGNIKLNALRPDQVQRLYTKKLNEGLSARTVQYIHAVLHKALNQALKWGLVNRNVTDLVEKPRPKRKEFKTWSADEVKQFLDAVSGHRWYPIYMLALYTGLRQGELLGIHRKDVDLDKGILHVRHQVTAIRGQGLTITEPKTEKARRPVTIPVSALEVIGVPFGADRGQARANIHHGDRQSNLSQESVAPLQGHRPRNRPARYPFPRSATYARHFIVGSRCSSQGGSRATGSFSDLADAGHILACHPFIADRSGRSIRGNSCLTIFAYFLRIE
jgi:hypothetical protein